MIYNDVDLYECKFFTLNKNYKIEFTKGEFRGKTPDDFNTVHELQRGVTYCFWILNKKDNPLVSKYMASAFMKELMPKLLQLESKLKNKVINRQQELAEETEEATKTVGIRYGKID